MSNLKVITYDVEHGNCHVVITPNGKYLMIDAGSKADFSPCLQVKKYTEKIRWFILTHHDSDHLTDVDNLFKEVAPATLQRNKMSRDELLTYYNELSEYQEAFIRYEAQYTLPAEPISSPNYDWGGVQFYSFHNNCGDFETRNINNLSVVTFFDYQGWTFLFPGDLEVEGWLKLLESESFIELLKRTDVLIASHHGRESGYCADIFNHFKPFITIISDKSITDTSVTDKYSAVSKGLNVNNQDGSKSNRSVLTTRKDGAIKFEITPEGRYMIDLFSTK